MITKYFLTGNILEVYQYEKYVTGRGGKKAHNKKLIEKEINEQILLNYANHNKVRQNMIRRLVCANFNNLSTFITFTFDDSKVDFDIHNVLDCNYAFKKFIQRLKRYLKNEGFPDDLKYVSVIEFQDKNDRRAVHYHAVFNIPYIKKTDLDRLWGLGFTFINKISHVDNVGAYLIKYMTKDNTDERLMGKPAYLRSRNLITPEEYLVYDLELEIDKKVYLLDSLIGENTAVYEANYKTDFMGNCIYKQYNLERK